MPRRLHRHYGSGHVHFITSSCYHQRPFLGTAARRNLFLTILEQVRLRYSFVGATEVWVVQKGEPARVFPSIPLPPTRFWSPQVMAPLYPGLSFCTVAMPEFPRQNRVLVDGA